MKYLLAPLSKALCLSFATSAPRAPQRFAKRATGGMPSHTKVRRTDRRRIDARGLQVNFRMISGSAAAALGLVCSEGASASTIVRVTYMAPAIVYAPPPRPVYYYVPAAPTYVVPVAAPIVPLPPPRPTTVVVQP